MKNFSKLNKLPLFFLAFMLFGLFVPLIRVQPALAAEKKIKIIDRTRIFYDGKVWVDNEPYDDVHEFENDSVGECEVQPGHSKAFIVLPNSPNSGAGISIGEKDEFGDGCNNSATSTRPKIEASTWERRLWTAYRRSADEIFVPDGTKDNIGSCTPTNDSSFATINDVNTGEGTLYRRNAAHDPPNDYFEVRDNGDLNDSNKIKTDGSTGKFFIDVTCEGGVLGASTHSHDYNNVVLAFNGEAVTGESGKCIPKVYNVRGGVCPEDDPNDPTTGSGTGIDGEGDQNATCEVAWNNPLTWIMCPIFNGMADLTDWMFKSLIEPFLYVTPVNTDPNEPAFQAWSSFRVYANILLIVAMLVIVMGQALGGGLVDAYTAKKVLPKILAAAILINLSVYAINLMIDITNIIGKGIGNLIYAPFKSSMGSFDLGLGQGGLAAAAGVGGAVAGAGTVIGFIGAGTAGLGSVAPFIALFMVLPAAVAIMGVFATIVIRQGLILFLIISSPIAFCLYALPNGEQYFKKWWDLLFKALMMYPIIVIVFCMADVLSITVLKASGNGGTVTGGVAAIVAFVLQFLPLFLIPFAFKLAGGAVASIYGAISSTSKRGIEGIKGSEHDPYSMRNHTRRQAREAIQTGKEKYIIRGVKRQKAGGRFGFIAKRAAGVNYEHTRAMMNKEQSDLLSAQTGQGGDSLVRALFAKQLKYRDKEGNERTGWFGTGARVGEDGFVVGKEGPDFAKYEVDTARKLHGRNTSAYQGALTYEMSKVANDKEYGELLKRNKENLGDGGFASNLKPSAGFIQLGSGYAMQSQRKEGKHLKLKEAADGKLYYGIDHAAFAQDMAENVQNYPLANMKTSTAAQMIESYDWANRVVNAGVGAEIDGKTIDSDMLSQAQQAQNDLKLTAQSIDKNRLGNTGQSGATGDGGTTPIITPIPGAASRQQLSTQVSTGAAGRADSQINTFVDTVLGPVDPNTGARTQPAPRPYHETVGEISERREGLLDWDD